VKQRWDVIVAGLGAMGSATFSELARRGKRVLGLDRYAPPHRLGSTHGRTRIIREAYFEHPLYVPLLQRAYELWDRLERDAGRQLFHRTGGLMIGPASGELVRGAERSAREHDLPHEMLSARDVQRRFPGLIPSPDMVALLEPRAGMLLPEACIESWLALAQQGGGEVRTNDPLLEWKPLPDGVSVRTNEGWIEAGGLVLSVGPWMPEMISGLNVPLVVERQLFHWFDPLRHSDRFMADACPIALWEYPEGHLFATFPDLGDGFKAGIHHDGEPTTPSMVRREPDTEDERGIRELLERFVPDAAGAVREARVCLYTNTPDSHFVIDRHPQSSKVVVVSACSGHGFKFASVVGEIAADLALHRAPAFDLQPFSAARF
jgi:sarcosine oxidase